MKHLSLTVSSGKFEAIPDDLTPEEILEQAQRAAQAATERLTLKRPNTNVTATYYMNLIWFTFICWTFGFGVLFSGIIHAYFGAHYVRKQMLFF